MRSGSASAATSAPISTPSVQIGLLLLVGAFAYQRIKPSDGVRDQAATNG